MGKRLCDGQPRRLPVTEEMASRVLRLPFFPQLTADEQREVISRIHDFFALASR